LESFFEEQSPVEEVDEIQVSDPKKKSNRKRQTASKKRPQKEKVVDQRCIPWTPEEETALCKECDKWNSGEVPLFMQEREEKKNKRYKSSGSSSFNTRESGEGSINLNTTIGDEEDEVEKVRRPRLMGRDQAKKKAKVRSAAGSVNAFDVESLANMMANKYVMASDLYNVQKSQEMSELLRIKNKELELKAAELKIRRLENRQKDKALYEMTTDEDLKAILRQMLFS
ncbi:hypothetical protein Tco_1463175, partial [Tanacetum coccineum]